MLAEMTMTVLVCALGSAPSGTVLHVDDDAVAGGDGSSWEAAYRHLQDALAHAEDGGVTEIRVAQGLHHPDEGADQIPGVRTMTFRLVDHVTIAGGYAGVGAEDPDARDIDAFVTILSGDLEDDDGPDFTNVSENALHVMLADDVDGAVLDGLTISGGYSNLNFPHDEGPAVHATMGDLTMRDCTVSANRP